MPWKCTDVTRHTASWGLTQSTKITRAVRADRGEYEGGKPLETPLFPVELCKAFAPRSSSEAMVFRVRSMPWIVPVEVQVLPVQENSQCLRSPRHCDSQNPRHSRVRVPLEMMVRGFVSTGKLCISNSAWQHCMANNFNIFCSAFLFLGFVILQNSQLQNSQLQNSQLQNSSSKTPSSKTPSSKTPSFAMFTRNEKTKTKTKKKSWFYFSGVIAKKSFCL